MTEGNSNKIHVGIIMDGNRRWARSRGLTPDAGHHAGLCLRLPEIIAHASNLQIKTLTAFAFSTENWGRASSEVDFLMQHFETFIREAAQVMVATNTQFTMIGDAKRLPSSLRQALDELSQRTASHSGMRFVMALNYGGRSELVRAFNRLIHDHRQDECVSEADIADHLDRGAPPNLDLLIRTGGEQRLSNFLLWQVAYAELYFSDVLWPDFSLQHLLEALGEYSRRQRRRGL